MDTNSPPLSTRMFPLIPVEDLERDILFAQGLGQGQSTDSSTDDQNMWCGHRGQLRRGTVCFSLILQQSSRDIQETSPIYSYLVVELSRRRIPLFGWIDCRLRINLSDTETDVKLGERMLPARSRYTRTGFSTIARASKHGRRR